jgi:hypothetical protein
MKGSTAASKLACNAAACGSIVGALFGSTFAAVPTALYPLHQTLDVGEAKEFEWP